MELRMLNEKEKPAAMALCWQVFLQFEAPDYPPEGVAAFRSYIDDEKAVQALTVLGAFDGMELTGVLAAEGNHVALFFVDPAYHRRGVGRALLKRLLDERQNATLTVNAAPYAVEIYRRLGFYPTDQERLAPDGIRYRPMERCPGVDVAAPCPPPACPWISPTKNIPNTPPPPG